MGSYWLPMTANQHSVALLSVGAVRSLLYPAVHTSLNLLRSSLPNDHVLFFFLTSATVQTAAHVRFLYGAAAVWVSNRTLPCNHGCVRSVPCRLSHDTTFNWFSQFHSVQLAWHKLQQYEQERRSYFEWVVKLRPDLLFFEPLPKLDSLARTAAYVPHGVMTRSPQWQTLNDHVMLCPHSLCGRYLDAVLAYTACRHNNMSAFNPPQLHFTRNFANGTLRIVELAYTLARPKRPECRRLDCSVRDSYSTGCLVPRLRSFVPACMRAASTWGKPHAAGVVLKHGTARHIAEGAGNERLRRDVSVYVA